MLEQLHVEVPDAVRSQVLREDRRNDVTEEDEQCGDADITPDEPR
jgi:hypothetical protein